MSDKNLTTFLTEWGGQVKALIEPKKEKLTPEFYLGSKANPLTVISARGSSCTEFEYIGDGELSISNSGEAQQVYIAYWENPPAIHVNDGNHYAPGKIIITSTETDNYKAGEWEFQYYIRT